MSNLLSGFTLTNFLNRVIGVEREGARLFYGPSLFGDISALLTGARAQPGKTVILLPGILGTSLVDSTNSELLWLELAGLTLGNGMKRLRAGDDAAADGGAGKIRAREPLVAFYGPMYAYFSEVCGFNTIPFGFDWRLSIGRAVEAFDVLINAIDTPKVTIVAHSMGSLVTRRWAELHPESAGRIEQAIFLGPPFSGSFAPLEALSGKAWFSSLLGNVIGADTLAATFGTFPGFAELVPDPSANHFPGSWATFANPKGPLAKFPAGLLARASGFTDAFRNPTDAGAAADDALMRRSSIVLGTRLRTAVSADLEGSAIRFRYASFGDNTVPLTSAWDDRATMYETRFPHSSIPQDPRVIRGVAQLIASGGLDSYPLSAMAAPPKGFTPTLEIEKAGLEALEMAPVAASPIDPGLEARIRTNEFTNADLASILSTPAPEPAIFIPRKARSTAAHEARLEASSSPLEALPELGIIDRCLQSLRASDSASKQVSWSLRKRPRIRLAEGLIATPDLAGWAADRAPEPSGGEPIALVPVWCAEVLSPTTARDIRSIKLSLYAASGVTSIWLIDPALRTVEIYRQHGGNPSLLQVLRDDAIATLPPFEGEVSLGAWWS